MRITFVHQHFKLPAEGGGMRGWEFSRRLVAAGHEVLVLCGRPANESTVIDGVRVIGVGASYSNKMGMIRRIISFLQFTVLATIKAIRIPTDLVFATSTPLTVAIPGIIASSTRKVPFVFEVRDLWPKVPVELGYIKNPIIVKLACWLEKIAYSKASVVVALSPGMKEGVLEVSPQSRVEVIPNAADFELFEGIFPKGEQGQFENCRLKKPMITYAGSFGDIYNIFWIVELAAHSIENADFQIIGGGKNENSAINLAMSHNLDCKTLFPGAMSKPEVAKRIIDSEICISSVLKHPALEPASINKVFDAMAAGKPIIFNHDGWLTELCVEKGAGWRLSDDPELAAEELSQIIEDSSLIDQAGKQSKMLGAEFEREKLFEKFESVLVSAV